MTERTRVYRVVYEDGKGTLANESWGDPYAPLLEVAEGPHQGKRGPDYRLSEWLGPIELDPDCVAIYETGLIRACI